MADIIIRTCQYIGPEQDPRNGPIHYCGAPVIEGKSYCHHHYGLIYQMGTAIRGRRKTKELDREIKHIQEKDVVGIVEE